MSDGTLRMWEITGLSGGSKSATSVKAQTGVALGAETQLGLGRELAVLNAHTASSVSCVRAFGNCKLLLSCAGGELVVTELKQGTRIRAFCASAPATAASGTMRCVCCDLAVTGRGRRVQAARWWRH